MNPDQIRRDQNNYGRRDTLHVRKGSGGGGGGKPRAPQAPKGHDGELQKLIDEKSPATLVFLDGDFIKGTIVARDKYTVTIEYGNGTVTGRQIVFKHALRGIDVKH